MIKIESTIQVVIAPETLYQDNLKLAEFFVRKYFPNQKPGTFLYDELTGEARVALWRAAKSYKPELSKFTTYAGKCIYGYLLKYYSRVHKKQSIAFDNSLDFSPNDNDYSISDLLISDMDTESTAIRNIVKAEAKKSVKENYPILNLYFLQGLTQTEISKKIGKSQITISRTIKKELIKIRKELKMA